MLLQNNLTVLFTVEIQHIFHCIVRAETTGGCALEKTQANSFICMKILPLGYGHEFCMRIRMVEVKIMQIFIQKIIPHASPEEKAFNSCVTLSSVLPDRVFVYFY